MSDILAMPPLTLQVPPRHKIRRAEFETLLAAPENADRRLELIHGEIYEKMPTEVHGTIAHTLHGELYIYQKQHDRAIRVSAEARHGLPDDPDTDLIPDIAVNLDTTRPLVERGIIPHMPDLAIEIKSPSDSYTAMREKASYYLQNGSRLVWLIYPERKVVEVYRAGEESELYTVEHVLDGGEVLPGFSLPVAQIFQLQ